MDELLTVHEAAAILKMHYDTVSRWVRIGKIPAVKVGGRYRIKQRSLRDWIDHNERGEIG